MAGTEWPIECGSGGRHVHDPLAHPWPRNGRASARGLPRACRAAARPKRTQCHQLLPVVACCPSVARALPERCPSAFKCQPAMAELDSGAGELLRSRLAPSHRRGFL